MNEEKKLIDDSGALLRIIIAIAIILKIKPSEFVSAIYDKDKQKKYLISLITSIFEEELKSKDDKK